MYLTVENVNNLNHIISEINNIEDEEQKEKFLNEHIEDTALFLDTIKKINKKKYQSDLGRLLNQEQKKRKQKYTGRRKSIKFSVKKVMQK